MSHFDSVNAALEANLAAAKAAGNWARAAQIQTQLDRLHGN